MRNSTHARLFMLALIMAAFVVSAAAAEKAVGLGPSAIPAGATVYIEANEGFDTYLRAAFQKKGVPLSIVVDKLKADYVMSSTMASGKDPGVAAAIFLGKRNANQDASISIVEIKSGIVRYSYAVHKYNAVNGKQSAAEAIAKNVKNKVNSRK
jgi:hypothetical protein